MSVPFASFFEPFTKWAAHGQYSMLYSAQKERGDTMTVIFKTISNWLYRYGKVNAGMPSIHGVYEAPADCYETTPLY